MASLDIPERRSFVRVVYGAARRPRLAVNGRIYEVADINQSGLRFIGSEMPPPSDRLAGTVTFPDGRSLHIEGRVEWWQDHQAGVSFDRLIPEGIIQREQRNAILAAD